MSTAGGLLDRVRRRIRRRMGRFDNAAQVAEELHVRYKLTVAEAWDVVMAEHVKRQGSRTDPLVLWRVCAPRAKSLRRKRFAGPSGRHLRG